MNTELFNSEEISPELLTEILKESIVVSPDIPPQPQSSIEDATAGNLLLSCDDLLANLTGSNDCLTVPINVIPPSQLLTVGLSESSILSSDPTEDPLGGHDIDSGSDFPVELFDTFSSLLEGSQVSESSGYEFSEQDNGIVPEGISPCAVLAETPGTDMDLVVKEEQGKSSKINRKRLSVSESSPSVAEDLTCERASGKKKTKMYELPNKNDPLVQRAGYAKSYREKKKQEKEMIKYELDAAKSDLQAAEGRIQELEEHSGKQAAQIQALTGKMNHKDKEIFDLKQKLKQEQEKNALNPEQTETICDIMQSVVKAACPPNVTVVNVIVPERLANKKVAAMGPEKILKIGSDANLQDKSCAFTFDLDEKTNKIIARKH